VKNAAPGRAVGGAQPEFCNTLYIVLLPLFTLYHGHLLTFNTSQTISRTSVYLRMIEKERYEELLQKLRRQIEKDEREHMERIPLPVRWFVPHTVLWEEWIAPILRRMFIILGFVCIAFYETIARLIVLRPNTAPNAPPDLILPPVINDAIFVVFLLAWLWIAIASARRDAHPLYGKGNMSEQFEKAWKKVLETKDIESSQD